MRGGGGVRLKWGQPMLIDDVAVDFPDMKIMLAHPSWPWVDESLSMALHKDNVFIDLSGWSPKYFQPQIIQYANGQLKKKMMFGSDFPLIRPDKWLEAAQQVGFKRRSAAGHHEGQRGAPAGAQVSEFAGRHVLVTGASSGIGLATARMLAARGARVSLIARSAAQLTEATAAIGRAGGTAAYAVADVADRGQLLAAMEKAERAFGPVAGLFANAGTGGRFAPLCEYDDEVFEAVLRTNLTSVYWAIKRVLPAMRERRAAASW